MRTLKKSLCLVLAVVMILGLGAFSVNAQYTTKDYSDAKKISHGEAVDVLGAIGVLEGDDNDGDGKIDYRPDDKLTRAQATKIITSMLGVTAVTAVAPFADVGADVAWAKDYIAYCAEQGIVEGVDDENNLFDPQGELTGGAFAKMLLTAMGYDAAIEGMAGTTSWLINVAKLVRNNNLDKGIANFPYDDYITRDDAAQLAFNALCAPLVGYDNKGGSISVNGATITTAPTSAKYMTTTVRDTQTISSALVNDGSTNGTYIVEFGEKYQPKLVRATQDKDAFGRPCTTWTYNREVIDTYTNESLRVAQWNDKYLESDAYKAVGGDLMTRLGNNTTGQAVRFKVVENGVEKDATAAYTDYLAKWQTNDGDKFGHAGQITEIYIDDDVYTGTTISTRYTQITVVVVDTWLGEVSSAKNSKGEAKVTVVEDLTSDFGGAVVTVKESDISNIGNFKEGDKVLVQMIKPGTKDRAVKVVMPCESMTDVYINAYTTDDGKMDTVTYDGSTYSVAFRANWNRDILADYQKRELKGFTYDLYKDQFGNLIGIEFNKTDTDYVFITAISEGSAGYLSGGSVSARLLYTDGTMDTKTVKLSDATGTTARAFFSSISTYAGPGVNGAGTTYTAAQFRGDNSKTNALVAPLDTDARNATDLGDIVADGTHAPAADHSQTVSGEGRSWTGTDNGAIVNRWFTYSKDDSGNITLRNAVGWKATATGPNSTGNIEQRAITIAPAGQNRVDIGSTNAQIQTDPDGRYAFGNDKTVYISVGVDYKPVPGGSITKVNKVTTGIQNTSITLMDIAQKSQTIFENDPKNTLNNFAMYNKYTAGNAVANDQQTYSFPDTARWRSLTTAAGIRDFYPHDRQWNNVYFVYDANTRYVLYAVCIAENTAQDVLFVTSNGPTKSEYINGTGYVDTYTGIRNGQKVTVQVDRDKSVTNDTKMTGGNMYNIGFNSDGSMIIDVTTTPLANTAMKTEANRTNGYAIDTAVANFDIKGNTLYTSSNADKYILLNNSTRYFVANTGAGGEDDYVEYKTAASAVSAAADNGRVTAVYADCDTNTGFAKSVILITNGNRASSSVDGVVVLLPEDIPSYTRPSVGGVIANDEFVVLYSGNVVPDNRKISNALSARLGSNFVISKVAPDAGNAAITDFTYHEVGSDVEFVYRLNRNLRIINVEILSGEITGAHGDILIDKGTTATISTAGVGVRDVYVVGTLNIDATLATCRDLYEATSGHVEFKSGTPKAGFRNAYMDGTKTLVITGGRFRATNLYIQGNVKVEAGGKLRVDNLFLDSRGSLSVANNAGLQIDTSANVSGNYSAATGAVVEINPAATISGASTNALESSKNAITGNYDLFVVEAASTYNWISVDNVSGAVQVRDYYVASDTRTGYTFKITGSTLELTLGNSSSYVITSDTTVAETYRITVTNTYTDSATGTPTDIPYSKRISLGKAENVTIDIPVTDTTRGTLTKTIVSVSQVP